MTTYDNLNIAQATLIFDENGSTAVGAGEFDLSSMAFLPNVPLIDQIEVERVFDTGADTKFSTNVFTIADRRQMFVFPKNWYTINEQTKVLKFVDLNTIPIGTGFEPVLYYPLSRTYKLVLDTGEDYINIPVVQNTTTSGPPVRQYDKVFIRRKTPSINSIVTFAPGTRLTTTQLNLQFDQLKYLVQEIVAKIRNEVILKYDENAVDGPFLGNGDLKMGNNFIKDLGSKEITDTNTFFTGQDNLPYSGGTFTANVLSVKNAVTKGAIYRTGLVDTPSTFTGNFTTRLPGEATNYKITNLAAGTAATDAVNLSQLNNADNLTAGTVGIGRLPLNIPLANLSSAAGQVYLLPLENLPNALSTTLGTFGQSSASNTNNMVYATVNAKGVLSSLGHRSMTVDDLPIVSGLVAQAYGGTGKLLTVTPDTKGRIVSISSASIVNADLPTSTVSLGTYGSDNATNALAKFTVDNKGIITSASHRSIAVADLPTTGVTQASTYGKATATNTNNMLQIAYDTTGRVTLASHRNMGHDDLPANIPLSKLSNALSQSYILPKDAIADGSILVAKLDTTTAGQAAFPLSFIPEGITLNKINPATYGAFVLPDACLNDTAVVPNAYSASPIKDITVDAKGRITSISQRAIVSGDIPALGASAISITTSPFVDALIPPLAVSSAGEYGSTTTIPTFTVDTKGRVTAAANSVALSTAHISNFDTNTNTLIDGRALSRGTSTTAYDAVNRLISNVATPVAATDAATKGYVDTDFTKTINLNTPIDERLLTNSVYLSAAGILNAGGKPITNVGATTNANDVVTKSYLEANAIYATGTNLSAGDKFLTNLIMRPSGSLSANDAVNFGYIETAILNAGGQQLVGTSAPQVFKQTWATANAISANTPATTSYIRYQFNFVDPTNVLYATSATMMLVEGTGGTRIFTPNLANATASGANAVYDGYFWLDTSGGATKVLNVYVNATPTGDITIRNFGLSRIVAGGTATTSATGLVSIAPGTEGGISVSGAGAIALIPATSSQIGGIKLGSTLSTSSGLVNVVFPIANNTTLGQVFVATVATSGLNLNTTTGALSLPAATTTQLGGIKQGSGLTITDGVAVVNLSSALDSTSTTTAATASVARTIYNYAVGVQSNLTSTNSSLSTTNSNVTTAQNTASAALPKAGGIMEGMLQLVGSNSTRSALRFVGGSAPTTSLTAGDVWFESNILKMRIGTTTKDIAFTDSALTGTAATATKLANARAIELTGPVTGTVNFDGSAAVTIATTITTNAVALGTNTTGDYLASATGTDGVSVTGSGGEGAGITIANTDKGSSQAIFKTITPSSGTSVTAATNASTLNLNGSGNITVTGSGSTITIANTATAPLTFGTIAVTGTAGQTSVVADTSAATLTLNASTGMSITTNATTDVITLANTGVTTITGTANQIIVTGTTTPTLSLPQNINTTNSPTFAGATLGSIIITSGAANTLTTTGNLDLILDPAGTGKISLLANVDCSTNTLTAGASTLGTLSCDAITFKANDTKLKLGTTASTIEAISTTSAGIYTAGDVILRVPATTGKAFLIADPTAVPTAGTALITKTALDAAVTSAISGGSLMPTAGTVHTAAQTLGCSVGSFNIQTGTTPVNRLTIVNGGAATFSGALTVTGGTTLSDTLVVTGTTTLNNLVTVNTLYNVTSAKAPTTGNHLANKTYVDAQDLTAPFAYELTLAKLQRDRTVNVLGAFSLGSNTTHTIDLTTLTIGVPTLVKYFTGTNATTGIAQLAIEAGESAYLLYKDSSAGTITTAVPLSALIDPQLYTVPATDNSVPVGFTPVTPTLLNTVGNTALWNITSTAAKYAGFSILRIS